MKTETKSQHTPGPWRVERYGAISALVDGSWRQVAMANGEAPLHEDRSTAPGAMVETRDANTRLIAQAPEMYAFIKRLSEEELEDFVDLGMEQMVLDARAILAAVGGKP